MSPRNDLAVLLAGALASGCPAVGAQTIADYSRAQRLALENAMIQSAARSAGLGSPAPVVSAPAAALALPSPPSPPASPFLPHAVAMAPHALPAAVQVSGIFLSGQSSMAEVVVDATAYLLQEGQAVPGTAWQVESVAVDRVVLSRRGGAAVAAEGAEAVRRVFALPALR